MEKGGREMERTIITISREYGSGGRLIGQKVAQQLGVPFYDKELIELAAEKSGLSPDFIRNSEETASSGIVFGLGAASSITSGYFISSEPFFGDKAFFAQAAVIRDLAAKGSCVIVGRCAGYLLREDPDCVSVFIHSNLDDRLRRAAQVYGMSPEGLADTLVKIDKSRANYHKYYTGERWNDMRAYHLAINTGMFGVDGAVQAIIQLVQNRVK